MAGNITLDNLVSVSELSHGGAGKTLSRVGDNNPIVVMRNNKPAAGVISPDEYRRLTEAEEDFALYLEAEERMKKGDGTRLGMDDVFGKEYKPVDDGVLAAPAAGLDTQTPVRMVHQALGHSDVLDAAAHLAADDKAAVAAAQAAVADGNVLTGNMQLHA